MRFGESNRITVAVDNRLTWQTLPVGEIKTYQDADHPPGYAIQDIQFDFFNYAGIHRSVSLYSTPHTHLADITTRTVVENGSAQLLYTTVASTSGAAIDVTLFDPSGTRVATGQGAEGRLAVPNPSGGDRAEAFSIRCKSK